MKAGLRNVVISAPSTAIAHIKSAEADLVAAGRVDGGFSYSEIDGPIALTADLVPAE